MEYRQALAAGTVLAGEYRIAGTLRQDGFCITYDAEDLQLKQHVLVKEFFPSEIADRVRLVTVRPKTTRQVGVLSWGRQRFIEEAQTLTKFTHPGVARMKRVIEENNTAYAVVEAEDWPTLLAWTNKLRRQPTQAELDEVARQLIDSLEVLHDAGVLVRDLSPESVYIRDKRHLMLVDFGTAKSQFAARARKMHAVVRPGYSAPEQYLFDDVQQGPWTDFFSLGAILYRLFTGRSPVEVIHRHNDDSMPKAAAGAPKGYRLEFLQAIDKMMSLDVAERPKAIKDLRALLLESKNRAKPAPAAAPPAKTAALSPPSATPATPATAPAPAVAPIPRKPPAPEIKPAPPSESDSKVSEETVPEAPHAARTAERREPTARPSAPTPAPNATDTASAPKPEKPRVTVAAGSTEPRSPRPMSTEQVTEPTPAARPVAAPAPSLAASTSAGIGDLSAKASQDTQSAPTKVAAPASAATPSAAARPVAGVPTPARAPASQPGAANATVSTTAITAKASAAPASPSKPTEAARPAGSSGRGLPSSAIPRSLLSDKAAEDDHLGFALDDLPEPEPDPEPAPGEGEKKAAGGSPIKSNPAHAAEIDAMAVSNRRFTYVVIGILVGLMAILGLGLVTLERTLRQEHPLTTEQQAERQRLAEEDRAREDARRAADIERKQLTTAAEQRSRIESEKKQREEADRKQMDLERQQAEAAERNKKAEGERQQAEADTARLKAEAERKQRDEETARIRAKLREDADRRLREEAERKQVAELERKQREEADRKAAIELKQRQDEEARQRVETERRQREQAALQKAEAERKRRDDELKLRLEAERKERDELDRHQREEAAKLKAEADLKARQEELARQKADAERRQLAEAELRRTAGLKDRLAKESNRDTLLGFVSQDPSLKGDVEKRLADLGFLRISSGLGEVWRKPGAGEPFRDCSTCPQLAVIPPGQFLMGSPSNEVGRQEDEDDTPGPGGAQVRVSIPRTIAVGRFEVTRGQFAAFVTETGHEMNGGCFVRVDAFELFPDLSWQSPGYPQTDEHPVACVSWLDAQAFVAWLSTKTGRNYRLLSEAEWEYAARGAPLPSLQPRFPFGNADRDLCAFGNGADAAAKLIYKTWQVARCNDGHGHTAPVGSFEPNPAGLQDMLGNVWEWVSDCYHDSYKGQPATTRNTGAAWLESCSRDLKVLRGGSWSDQPDSLRAAARIAIPADKRIQIGGFRVARSLEP